MGSHKVGLVLAVHPRLQQCLLCLCCIGYPISDATWELEDNLVQDVLDLLKAYQKEKMLISSHKEVELPKLPKTRSTSRSRASKDEVEPHLSKVQKALQKGLCK